MVAGGSRRQQARPAAARPARKCVQPVVVRALQSARARMAAGSCLLRLHAPGRACVTRPGRPLAASDFGHAHAVCRWLPSTRD